MEVDPQYGVHRLVREMKGRSSPRTAPGVPFIGYTLADFVGQLIFRFDGCDSPLAIVKQYIENQKQSER